MQGLQILRKHTVLIQRWKNISLAKIARLFYVAPRRDGQSLKNMEICMSFSLQNDTSEIFSARKKNKNQELKYLRKIQAILLICEKY